MNAVIVDGDLSYPATSGKRLRTLNLMLRLARRHRITYIARSQGDPAQAKTAREVLADHGITPILVDDPLPRKAGLGFLTRLAANVLSPYPYSVTSHNSSRMRAALAAHAAAHAVDLWQIESSSYLLTLPPDRRGATLLNAHNVDFLIWQRYAQTERHPLKRWYIRQQWHKLERFERRVFQEVSRVAVVSAEDAALARTAFGVNHVDVVDNGIDRSYYESVRGRRCPKTILFLGSLDWRPNLDGLTCLLDVIFPAVRAQVGDARLCIVGRKAPSWLLQKAAAQAGIEVHSDVPDVRPYLAESGVMVVPLRIGGGSRLKILEALACGLPVVSTGVGAEGLAVRAGEHYLRADEPADMAAALVQAIRNPEPLQALAERGRQLAFDRYDWDTLADKLEEAWVKCVHGRRAPALVHQA